MKKVLSLALVLCMAIACFAFAPASAEIYWDNLLTVTEENGSIQTTGGPWEWSGTGMKAWAYGGKTTASNNPYAPTDGFVISSAAAGLFQNNFGDAKSVKVDFSNIYTHGNGLHNQVNFAFLIPGTILTAGETYTFFFKAKAADAASLANVSSGSMVMMNEDNYATGTITVVSQAGTLSTEWSTFKLTFTATAAAVAAIRVPFFIAGAAGLGTGAMYMDGFSLVEGTADDTAIDAYYAYYKDPMDIDGDGLLNATDPDVDGDGILNRYDRDIDGDGTKNVWDRDMDGDGIPNRDDLSPFGG